MQECTPGLDYFTDFFEVFVVDSRDHHRIDLHQNAAIGQHLQTLLLLLDQDPGPFFTLDTAVVPEYPWIDLGADLGIHAIDRDRDMVDVVPAQPIDLLG